MKETSKNIVSILVSAMILIALAFTLRNAGTVIMASTASSEDIYDAILAEKVVLQGVDYDTITIRNQDTAAVYRNGQADLLVSADEIAHTGIDMNSVDTSNGTVSLTALLSNGEWYRVSDTDDSGTVIFRNINA